MNVIITGASRGIGLEMVIQLMDNPAIDKIFILTRNTHPVFTHKKVEVIATDFLKADWLGKVNIPFDVPIHLLINNSGYLYNAGADVTPIHEVERMTKINFLAPFQLVQHVLPQLKLGKAHLINIGSMGGFTGSAKFPGLAAYSATKSAAATLSECWAEEFKSFGIKSNCLALGAVNTEMLKEAFPGYVADIDAPKMAKGIIDFALNFDGLINGKVIPLSVSVP